jgi:hypothetical protein
MQGCVSDPQIPLGDWMTAFLEILGQPRPPTSSHSATQHFAIIDELPPDPVLALDDEAGDEYELYLVGTASERDALNLNSLTSGVVAQTPLGPGDPPGSQMRQVSPSITFVRYVTRPYGAEDEIDNGPSAIETLIGLGNISAVLSK